MFELDDRIQVYIKKELMLKFEPLLQEVNATLYRILEWQRMVVGCLCYYTDGKLAFTRGPMLHVLNILMITIMVSLMSHSHVFGIQIMNITNKIVLVCVILKHILYSF